MSTPNTNININLIDSVNHIVAGAKVSVTVAGVVYNLVTNSAGFCSASLALTNITIASINVTAAGYLNNTATYVVSPLTNTYTITLSVDPTQINKTLQIFDINSNPVPNVVVSVNGTVVGKTDTSGLIQIVTDAGFVTLQTSLAGYRPLLVEQTYNSFNFPSQLIIQSANVNLQVLTFQTTPFTTIDISGNGLTDETIADSNGIAISNISFSPGNYSLALSQVNYVTSTISLVVRAGVSSYALPLLQAITNTNPSYIPPSSLSSLDSNQNNSFPITSYGDSNAPPISSSSTPGAAPSTSTAINIGSSTESSYPSEWVYPNSSDGKYLTGSQARIYIGNLFIDEIDTLYYAYNNNRIPIYGYSSTNVDAFGQGRRLVQGQLTINFVSEGYLFTVLSEYKKKNINNNLSPSQAQNQAAIMNLASLHTQQASLLSLQAMGDKSSATASQLATLNNSITTAYSSLGVDAASQVKQVLANATTASSTSNAIIKDIAFDIIINASGGGRTTTRKLSRCLLTTNEQVWDQSDNVIKDVYGFIGVELT